jgi:hypothetical protein
MKIVFGSRWWAFAVLGVTLMAVILSAFSIDSILRSLTVLIWVTACPGTALARRLGKLDGLVLIVVGVALSLVMAQSITAALMYLHVYSWQVVFAALATVTLACIVPDLRPTGPDGELHGI